MDIVMQKRWSRDKERKQVHVAGDLAWQQTITRDCALSMPTTSTATAPEK
jgi:hypothetical protein